jgi:hypothetical protein
MRDLTHWLCTTVRTLAILLTFLVLSAGTSIAQQYQEPQEDPHSGALAMAYEVERFDGKLAYDPGYKEEPRYELPAVKLYPYPVPGVITIGGLDEVTYTVVDMFGRILVSGPLTNHQIDISEFANGMYLINFTTPEGEVRSARFTRY